VNFEIIEREARGHDGQRITFMVTISAQMVKELRERTGAGMMDCKGALSDTGGDMERAVDLLRKKGLAKAAKKAGRIAAEGLIGVAVEGLKGVVVEVNSETDFVARNELFQGLVKMIANVALTVGADLEKIRAAKVGSLTVDEAIADTIAKVGENMSLRRAASLSVGKGIVASYVHNSVDEGLGKIGVIVGLESSGKADELKRFGRMVAMHVAASNPQAIDSSGLDPDLIRREREVLSEKFKAQGKPPHIIDRIVESGLKTFYAEVCLLDQEFIHEPDKSVAQAVQQAAVAAGSPIAITGFVRYALGEGIDRPDKDFAAEVAAAGRG
jgi:elongation factor Ts